jgi:2-polyprenyl-3-methyl-5-hydroxy-6-metoxy-1,4-benzoquinol methylase
MPSYCQHRNCLKDGTDFPRPTHGAATSDSAYTDLAIRRGPPKRMRYIIHGREIRSENAAKPASSAGRWMLHWIGTLPPGTIGLDLGCGKLRYTIPLAKRIASVTAVDSSVQLNRKQLLFGKVRSIREYASEKLPNVRVCALDKTSWRRRRYQIILCSNVLSAVPCRKARKALISAAHSCLAPQGRLLLTTQYRNSYFEGWRGAHRATPYMDGFLVRGKRGTSFYGLLNADALARLCRTSGFRILRAGHVKELAYVLADRQTRASPGGEPRGQKSQNELKQRNL